MTQAKMLEVMLSRIVIREGVDHQYIYLAKSDERDRGFPIVIGSMEAQEIHRVVHSVERPRPMTHQLTLAAITALGARIKSVDIVDLRQNTFFAHVVIQHTDDENQVAIVDARPSDAIALAMRARCQIRVAEEVFLRAEEQNEGDNEKPGEKQDDET